MPVLLYCITENSSPVSAPTNGVAGLAIKQIERSGLKAFASEHADDLWSRSPLREAASEFYRVIHEVFRSAAIIPFRFPTVLASEEELAAHLDSNSGAYKGLLARFRDSVQMEALITCSAEEPKKYDLTGTAYLRQRQEMGDKLKQASSALRKQAAPVTNDWRARTVQNGWRCFALVDRSSVREFKSRMQACQIAAEFSVRISGPWPVTEFLDISHV